MFYYFAACSLILFVYIMVPILLTVFE